MRQRGWRGVPRPRGLRHCNPRSLTQVILQPRHTMAATNKCLARSNESQAPWKVSGARARSPGHPTIDHAPNATEVQRASLNLLRRLPGQEQT